MGLKPLATSLNLGVSYIIVASVMFGNPFAPLLWKFTGYDSLKLDNFLIFCFAGMVSYLVLKLFFSYLSTNIQDYFFVVLPLFLVLFMLFSFALTAFYFDLRMKQALRNIQPDHFHKMSFYQSVLDLDNRFRFRHHAHAIKDCRVYIWSYGSRSFSEAVDSYDQILPYEVRDAVQNCKDLVDLQ